MSDSLQNVDGARRGITTPIQWFQLYSKYSRWDEAKKRREAWEDVVHRSINFLRREVGVVLGLPAAFSDDEWAAMSSAIYWLEATPSMRLIQMAGPAAERCNVCIYNCAYLAHDSVRAMAEMLYVLMQGTGCGFSVEMEFTDELPDVKPISGRHAGTHVVGDSDIGWCEALRLGMTTWLAGDDIAFDVSGVRKEGERLKTKGGRSSGPKPLIDLLAYTRDKIRARAGQRLRPIDIHDIACKVATVGELGGVRRAATISFSDLEDNEMRGAKVGAFWDTEGQRTMANNSAVFRQRPTPESFAREWNALRTSGTGERGIFNLSSLHLQLPARRRFRIVIRCNPCGEINLPPDSFCNLSIATARPWDTADTLERKVRLAARFGTIQSTMTSFRYLNPRWRQNCEEERLLGVDIAGACDCPLLRPDAPGRAALLRRLRDAAIDENKIVAARLGINPSVAVTCTKPGGNSSVFMDLGNTITGRFSAHYIRRCRLNAIDPLCALLIDTGVPHAPEYGSKDPKNPAVWVFDFPVKSPDGALLKDDLTAIEQLKNWLEWKVNFTEHNPSATIYVREGEWDGVGKWVLDNWDIVGGLAFLPHDGGVYPLAPYEAITAERYEELLASFPDIPWERLSEYESTDMTTGSREIACAGGNCEI